MPPVVGDLSLRRLITSRASPLFNVEKVTGFNTGLDHRRDTWSRGYTLIEGFFTGWRCLVHMSLLEKLSQKNFGG